MSPFLLSFTPAEITSNLVLETGGSGYYGLTGRLVDGIAFEALGYTAERA
jgi:hypothetical protein